MLTIAGLTASVLAQQSMIGGTAIAAPSVTDAGTDIDIRTDTLHKQKIADLMAVQGVLQTHVAMQRSGDAGASYSTSHPAIDAGATFRTTPGFDVGSNRIVGGEECTDYPAVGALLWKGRMHCTATVIGKKTLLTAAHCLTDVDYKQLKFVTGPSAWEPEDKFAIVGAKSHDQYIAALLEHNSDVALLFLEREYSGTPLSVAAQPDKVSENVSLRFIGYGYAGLRPPSNLMLGLKRCVDIAVSKLDTDFIKYGDAVVNTCNGDSGGPAIQVVNGVPTIVGITSWGDSWCNKYGYDARVSAFHSWIQKNW